MRKLTALVLALTLTLAGCSSGGSPAAGGDLMKGVRPQQPGPEPAAISGEAAVGPTDFAVRLFQAGFDPEENTMLSPVSVLCALAMTANGARDETLAQMEEVFGMTVPTLNAYLKAYLDTLPEGKRCKLHMANSIWLTEDDRFTVVPEFLQANADYYGAGIYQLPFDDAACRDINAWVERHTDGMVRDILDQVPADAVMYLVNAMAFDAEWQRIYQETQIRNGVFTTEGGETQDVEMMHSEERWYLEDAHATGFLKHYADSRYAFAALLPKEGVSVQDYLATLTGQGLASMLANAQETMVIASMPKFESEYSVEMREILTAMGMEDAFNSRTADFSGLGSSSLGNVYISRVLHKTFIAVDEKGTKAGAATVVEAKAETAPMIDKEVLLDRPFVYMIIDCEANLPLFMGALLDAA